MLRDLLREFARPTLDMNLRFVICINNTDYLASLEKRKVYQVIEDLDAEKHGQLRFIDESGENYLFPREYFVAVDLPSPTEQAIISAA